MKVKNNVRSVYVGHDDWKKAMRELRNLRAENAALKERVARLEAVVNEAAGLVDNYPCEKCCSCDGLKQALREAGEM